MKCANCGHENPTGEMFCEDCGEELKADAVQVPTATPTPQATPTATCKKVATLKIAGTEIDLMEGGKLTVARKDTDKCNPDVGLDDATVSSMPIEIVGNADGTITVEDTGTSTGFRIVKLFKPGEKANVQIGDMIMVGKQLIMIE